jgi:two-component system, sporulation sensor kinase E
VDIYNNKSKFKIAILVVSLLVGVSSIYYTQSLVKKLAQREQKLIDLYATGLHYAVDPNYNNDLTFLFQEILDSNSTIPVILTDEQGIPQSHLNIRFPKNADEKAQQAFLLKEIEEMKKVYPPIVIDYSEFGFKNYIYYKNSYFLTQLMYYPYIQLSIIAALGIIAYVAFSYSRNAEQNRVWVGLAKETAHQLGTPLSSLMAWVEILKSMPENKEVAHELSKDVQRLEMITARFSNIGSSPTSTNETAVEAVRDVLDYLDSRTSDKVRFVLQSDLADGTTIKINKPLFDWVLENICKNGIDAMDGIGQITIRLSEVGQRIAIDISDTGKGIPRSKFKDVFKPGYTTKKRGWGLGLTLVKRIVETYHRGKILVLESESGKGTTFRVLIEKGSPLT